MEEHVGDQDHIYDKINERAVEEQKQWGRTHAGVITAPRVLRLIKAIYIYNTFILFKCYGFASFPL